MERTGIPLRMREATNKALWEKHSLREYLTTLHSQMIENPGIATATKDVEGDLVRQHTQGEMVYELGCGDTKTLSKNIGVDICARGAQMGGVYNPLLRCRRGRQRVRSLADRERGLLYRQSTSWNTRTIRLTRSEIGRNR